MARKRKQPSDTGSSSGPGLRGTGRNGRARLEQERPPSAQPSPARPSPVERDEDTTGLTQDASLLSVSPPDSPKHIQYRNDLRTFLGAGISDQLICCKLFLDQNRQLRLLEYRTNLTDGLDKLALVVFQCLYLADDDIREFKKLVSRPKKVRVDFVEKCREKKSTFYPFVLIIMERTNDKPNVSQIDAFVAGWKAELQETIDHYRNRSQSIVTATAANIIQPAPITSDVVEVDVVISEYDMRNLRDRIRFIKSLSPSDPIMTAFREKAGILKQRVNPVTGGKIIIPCEFICAPSGTGKTTFMHRICCGDTPCLYGLFDYNETDRETMQKVYVPFGGVSMPLITTASNDLDMLRSVDVKSVTKQKIAIGEELEYLLSSQSMIKYAANERLKFHFVGFLVAWFERVIELHDQNPHLTWLELQCSLDKIEYSPTTIENGASALKTLRRESAMPLILVMDECSMSAKASSSNEERFMLTRNLCRCLDILVVFMGTDVRASNLISKRRHSGIDSTYDYPEWTIGFNFCPSYDNGLLNERCDKLRGKLQNQNRRDLIVIVDFVQKVAEPEIPWLIDLCLTKMEQLVNSAPLLDDPLRILNEVFKYCWANYFIRKTGGLANKNRSKDDFYRGQLRYMSNFYWQGVCFAEGARGVRRCFGGKEILVNRHVAYLFAYPDRQDLPHFALSADGTVRVYSKSPQVAFEPSSVYSSFKDAPITGMSMIGLYPDHNPFNEGAMYDAWKIIGSEPIVVPPTNSGVQLELLFNFGAILASKVNGPKGCGVIEFLGEFLRQLGCKNNSLLFDGPFPWDIDENGQPRRIPLLCPMSVCSWNPELVDLFESIMPAGERPCLGFYRSCKANEPCDGIAYLFDKSRPIEAEADDDELKEAMDLLSIKYPKPFVRPRIGTIAMLNEFPRNAVFASECKQYEDALSRSDIVKIVFNKFTKEEVGNCQLFFIFTTRISDNAVNELSQELPKQRDPTTGAEIEDLRLNGVLFWKLNVVVEKSDALIYSLDKLALPPSRANQSITKHVILLTLETIWVREFKDNYIKLSSRQ